MREVRWILAVTLFVFSLALVTRSQQKASRPFDVQPKQWDDPYRVEINSDPPPTTEHHIACEDKSRFLLQSEDGKWHCLDFNGIAPKP